MAQEYVYTASPGTAEFRRCDGSWLPSGRIFGYRRCAHTLPLVRPPG